MTMNSILLATFSITVLCFTALWAISVAKRDAGIVDFWWGPGFVVTGWIAAAMADRFDWLALAFLACLTAWGLRLGWYMVARHGGAEDARYAAMRERHGDAFGRKSLWMVFWLQAVIQWLASSPALVLAVTARRIRFSSGEVDVMMICLAVGFLLFVAGFGLEAAADREVARFKANPANKDQLLTTGLHARIRHPNYLGEIILQCGLGLMAFGLTLNAWAFLGPALMTGLIIKLSGVPMLEEQFAKRPGFAEWRARTGALWPRFRVALKK
jgi:steroid 5-alpha reductase family enzyme